MYQGASLTVSMKGRSMVLNVINNGYQRNHAANSRSLADILETRILELLNEYIS